MNSNLTTPKEALIEKVARAICAANGRSDPGEDDGRGTDKKLWQHFEDDAKAAIAAMSEQEPGEPDRAIPSGGREAGSEEDRIEASYWRFDARHRGHGKWKSSPMSERDAFKVEMRNALAAEKTRSQMRMVAQGWLSPNASPQPAAPAPVVQPEWDKSPSQWRVVQESKAAALAELQNGIQRLTTANESAGLDYENTAPVRPGWKLSIALGAEGYGVYAYKPDDCSQRHVFLLSVGMPEPSSGNYENTAPVRDEREAFEVYARREGLHVAKFENSPKHYHAWITNSQWCGWQARAALASKEKP